MKFGMMFPVLGYRETITAVYLSSFIGRLHASKTSVGDHVRCSQMAVGNTGVTERALPAL